MARGGQSRLIGPGICRRPATLLCSYAYFLRQLATRTEFCQTHFETPAGQKSQIDWGEVVTELGGRSIRLHIFALALGSSRRGFCGASPDQQLPQLLEALERHRCSGPDGFARNRRLI